MRDGPIAFSRRGLFATLLRLGWLALAACARVPVRAQAPAGGPTPAATAEPTAPAGPGSGAVDDAAATAGIQAALERRAAALAAADRAAYMAVVDQRNLTWRRIQQEVFDAATAGGTRAGPHETYSVTRVLAKPFGYFKAWIDVAPASVPAPPPGRGASAPRPARQVVWVFRPTADGWLHSEVLNEELGPRLTRETEHFALAHYAWDEDVLDRMAAVAERAHARTAERLGYAPDGKAQASLNPTYGAHSGLRGLNTVAAYVPGADGVLLIRSIESFGAGATAPGQAQEDLLLPTVTHELTHLFNDRVVALAKMQPWMKEGLAEWVADHLRAASLAAALRARGELSLDRANDVIEWKDDPARGYSPADVDLAYAQAASAVAYFMERFGRDAFFDLARTYADTRGWEDSFARVTATPWPQFQRDWLDWTRRRLTQV